MADPKMLPVGNWQAADREAAPAADRQQARRLRRTRRNRRRLIAITITAVIVAAGVLAWRLTGASATGYRTAAVTRGSITQTVDADGVVHTTDQAALTFATSGTVAKVLAAQGGHVTAGQVLARLDPTNLDAAVNSATDNLARAKQTLADDQAAQSATTAAAVRSSTPQIMLMADVRTATPATTTASVAATTTAAPTTASTGTTAAPTTPTATDRPSSSTTARPSSSPTARSTGGSPGRASGGSSGGTSGGAPSGSSNGSSLTKAQQAVVSAVHRLDMAVAALDSDISIATAQCSSNNLKNTSLCDQAVATVAADRTAVTRATRQVDNAIQALTTALGSLRTGGSTGATGGSGNQAPTSGQFGTGQSGTRQSGAGQSGSGQSGSGQFSSPSSGSSSTGIGQSTQVVTAAQVAADQKAVDAARAWLNLAERNRTLAALTSPISGTVADVAVSTGQSIGASTTAVTVVGSNRKSVTVDIGISSIDLVKVGQHAAVSVDGRTTPISGTVTRIGLLNTASSSSSTAAYAVTINLDRSADTVHDGTGASIAISVGTATQVLTVPLSAIQTVGTIHTVEVYADGKVTRTVVTLGVIGSDTADITRGLTEGEHVVLANIGEAVPSSTTTSRFGGGFGGRFGGGLRPGG